MFNLFKRDTRETVTGRMRSDGKVEINKRFEDDVRSGRVRVVIDKCKINKQLRENACAELLEGFAQNPETLVSDVPYNWIFVDMDDDDEDQ